MQSVHAIYHYVSVPSRGTSGGLIALAVSIERSRLVFDTPRPYSLDSVPTNPGVCAQVWEALGTQEESHKNQGAAAEAYQRAVELDPEFALAMLKLANL